MRYVHTVTIFIQNLLFVAMLLVAGLVVLNQTYLKQRYKFYTVMSGSMEPTLHIGSVAVITAKPEYQVGDIVTARSTINSKETVTHRIFSMEEQEGEDQILLKGDANEDPDLSFIGRKQIVGMVLFSIPFVGRIIEYSKTQQGFIFVVVIPATIFAYHEVLSMIEEVKKIFVRLRTKYGERKEEKALRTSEDVRHKTQNISKENKESKIKDRAMKKVKKKRMKVIGKGKNRESRIMNHRKT